MDVFHPFPDSVMDINKDSGKEIIRTFRKENKEKDFELVVRYAFYFICFQFLYIQSYLPDFLKIGGSYK